MAGTREGGKAAAATNRAKYGANFYARIGSTGGKLGRTGGFFANRELARAAGQKGGRKSKRHKALKPERIEELRALRRSDPERWSYGELSLEFGISHSTVGKYVSDINREEHEALASEHEQPK